MNIPAHKMSVEERCSAIGWTVTDLSHEARIAWVTANKAYHGEQPMPRTQRDICSAFSKAFGYEVGITDVAWIVDSGEGVVNDGES